MLARTRRLPLVIGVLLVALCAIAAPATAAPDTVPGRYIVLLKSTSTSATVTRLSNDTGVDPRLRYTRAIKGFSAKMSRAQVRDLRDDPAVVSVTPDYVVHADAFVPLASGEPTPPTGVRRLGAATTTTARQASSANVAVIDTGIDLTHPDLNAVAGKNCVNTSAQPQDDNGHGSHVSGIIGARNNGAGVDGVAPGTKLYAVKVLDASGSGTSSEVICGIDWVTANAATLGIKVANMSLGGDAPSLTACPNTSDPEHKAICNSVAAGVTYAVAAGNDGVSFEGGGFFSPPESPAVYPEVLTVTAMSDSDGSGGAAGPRPACRTGERDDATASFSNFARSSAGQAHTIAGPGVCIFSTWMNGGYNTISGTSMATPHVTGAIALCLGDGGSPGPCAGMTPAQIIQKMRSDAAAHTAAVPSFGFSGDPAHAPSSNYFGYLAWAGNAPSAPPPPPPVVTTGAANPVGATTATLGGSVNPSNLPAHYHFEYGTTPGYGSSTPAGSLPAGGSAVSVSADVSGLAPNTTYHFKLVADNGSAPVDGGDQQFKTAPPPAPVVTTGDAGSVGAKTATLAGTVNPSGFAASYHFEYGTGTSYGTSTPSVSLPAGSSPVGVSANVSGLSPSQTYHFKLVADNGGGPVSGGDNQFDTLAPPPPAVVTTGDPSSVGASGATVGGTVDPQGQAYSYHFEYGTGLGYGTSTPTVVMPASATPVGVTATLSGLSPGTTYHFKLVADNGSGAVSGGDNQFDTAAAPAGTTKGPASVTVDSGTLTGGGASSLAAADASYLMVQGAISFSPLGGFASWYGTFTALPAAPANLSVSYAGKSSATCTQTIQIYRWSTATWVNLDSRSVGTTETTIAGLVPPGASSQYVSGGSLRVRVQCRTTGLASVAVSANLLTVTYG